MKNTSHIIRWTRINAGFQFVSLLLAAFTGDMTIWVVLSLLPFLLVFSFARNREGRSSLLSVPNGISALRLLITYGAIWLWAYPSWVVFLAALFLLILDAIDGLAARRLDQQTAWGEILDKDVDAVLVSFLCLFLWQEKAFPVWVLVLAMLRYVYVLVRMILIDHRDAPEPRFRYGPFLAAFFIGCLLGAVLFPPPFDGIALFLGAVVTLYSFGRSFMYLFSAKNHP